VIVVVVVVVEIVQLMNRELIQKETGLEKEFITRMLFKNFYWQNDCVSD